MKEHNAQNSQDNFEGKKYGGGNLDLPDKKILS